ncbi:hypothetical protein ACTJKQ_23705 [Acidovorax sp. 22279]|uniref:hypothetical protein n=1 Tax=Acidovorax sp. 22279 TaxID=3453900 RepID=UPI003F86A455
MSVTEIDGEYLNLKPARGSAEGVLKNIIHLHMRNLNRIFEVDLMVIRKNISPIF